MVYSIDIQAFFRLGTEIAELANIAFATERYKVDLVEICALLVDYNDGFGHRLISRALLRNATELSYDLVTDVQGTPEEALKLMIRELKEKAEKNHPLQYQVKLFKYN